MRLEIRPKPAAAFAFLSDESFHSETMKAATPKLSRLRKLARSGRTFFMQSDDPVYFRIDLYLDEEVPGEVDSVFTGKSGAFLLQAPTGRLVFALPGDDTLEKPEPCAHQEILEIPGGDYAVSVHDRQVADLPAYETQVRERVGERDWRFYNRLNWTGALGCLCLAVTAGLMLLPFVRSNLWFLLFPAGLPTLTYLIVSLLPRYRRVKAAEREYEASLPGFVLVLRRVASTEGLRGGWFTY